MSKTIIIASGGTGGHLYPTIAIADTVKRLAPEIKIIFVGTRDRIESREVPRAGYEFFPIDVEAPKKTIKSLALFGPKMLKALIDCLMLANREKQCAMLGGGAYLSVPMGLAAWAMHVPISLLEINSIGGTANKLLSRFSDKIFLAYPESSKDFNASKKKITICGTPVRSDLGSSTSTTQQARAHFGLDPERETVLVFGGSLGARAINEAMRGCVDRLAARGYNVLWQCGKANDAEGLQRAHNSGYVRVQEFIYEMNDAYRAADLVVCRAGASSLAELSTLGKPAILVPYPFAAANHQEANAKAFEQAGAAQVLRDHELKSKLESQVIELMSDKSRLSQMAQAMHQRENKESAKIVAEWLIERCKNAH